MNSPNIPNISVKFEELPVAAQEHILAVTLATPRSLYRVTYFLRGVTRSAFVCAASAPEATEFIGVRDGSASIVTVASPVEVVGLDAAHDALPELPVNKL